MGSQEQRDTQEHLESQGREVRTESQGRKDQWGLPGQLVNQVLRATQVIQGYLALLGYRLRASLVPRDHMELLGPEVRMVFQDLKDLQAHLVPLVR